MLSFIKTTGKIKYPLSNLPNISVSQLNTASALIVWAIQYWCRSNKECIDSKTAISDAFDKAKINSFHCDVSYEFDNIMTFIAASFDDEDLVNGYGNFHCIGNIEKILLIVLSLEQNNEIYLSSRILHAYFPLASARVVGRRLAFFSGALSRVKLFVNIQPGLLDTMASLLSGNLYSLIKYNSIH